MSYLEFDCFFHEHPFCEKIDQGFRLCLVESTYHTSSKLYSERLYLPQGRSYDGLLFWLDLTMIEEWIFHELLALEVEEDTLHLGLVGLVERRL